MRVHVTRWARDGQTRKKKIRQVLQDLDYRPYTLPDRLGFENDSRLNVSFPTDINPDSSNFNHVVSELHPSIYWQSQSQAIPGRNLHTPFSRMTSVSGK
jgi:hypothetical protein